MKPDEPSGSVKPVPASPVAAQSDTLAPQLRLDADGNIVLDEASLLVTIPNTLDRNAIKYVNEDTGVLGVTYNSFRKPSNCNRKYWSAKETVRFYRALSTIGMDYFSMLKLFPDRSREDLKVCSRWFLLIMMMFLIMCDVRSDAYSLLHYQWSTYYWSYPSTVRPLRLVLGVTTLEHSRYVSWTK